MPVNAHYKDKPRNTEAVRGRRWILNDRLRGESFTSRADWNEFLVAIFFSITTSTSRENNQRRDDGTQLIGFTNTALLGGWPSPVVKAKKRGRDADVYNTCRRNNRRTWERSYVCSNEVCRNYSQLRLLNTGGGANKNRRKLDRGWRWCHHGRRRRHRCHRAGKKTNWLKESNGKAK